MVRSISGAIEIEKNKEFNRPVEIYELYLDDFNLYLAMYPKDLEDSNNGITYEAYALSRSPIRKDIELQANRVNIDIDNVDKTMSAYLTHFDFSGRKIVIKKAFLNEDREIIDTLSIFTGFMDEATVDHYNAEITATGKLDLMKKSIPGRKFSIGCNWQFGDEDTCGVEISEENDTKRSGTIVGTDGEYKIYLDEITGDDDNYWAYGYIEVKYGIEGQEAVDSRLIVSSGTEEFEGQDTGYIELDVPFFVDVEGEDYELFAGCDKTFGVEGEDEDEGVEMGHGCKFWDNEDRYGGFRSLPEARDVFS